MRAARHPPAAPATRPPRIATSRPSRRMVIATGAVRATWSVTVRALTAPSPKKSDAAAPPPVEDEAVSVGPTAPMSAARADSEDDADDPADRALREGLADDLADDERAASSRGP